MNGSDNGSLRQPARARALPHPLLVAPIVLMLAAPAALAADAPITSISADAIFIAELGLLLLVGRLGGEAAQRLGQPAVMGQLLGGLVLGPSVLGLIWPAAQHALFPSGAEQRGMINAVAQLGILMLLLLTGMETDLQLVKRVGRAAVTVAAAGVALPFLCGFALGEMLPAELLPKPDARLVTAIFLGTALSISSVKIVAMVVRDMNFMRRDLGQIIVASAILEDTIGWVIIAIAFGLASAGTIDAAAVARAVLGTAAFMVASLTIGRRIVFSLIRWANDNFESEFPVITTILLIMVALALTTQLIGVNTVLGAFVAGILIGESPILTRHIDEQLRGLIVALFMPVFFGLSGLSADMTVLKSGDLALLAVGLIVIASIGKFLGAFVGGKLGGLTRAESLALGCAMNARGSTEVIVASIGLSMGVLNQNLFTVIVTMAVLTTMAMPAMLRWALKRLPMRKSERLRLEREKLDARGFVTNLERLLLVADDSPNGKFASRLAGIIAGSGGKPTTVVDLAKARRGSAPASGQGAMPAGDAEQIAASRKGNAAHEQVNVAAADVTAALDGEEPDNVEIIKCDDTPSGAAAVADEARKGYDLLIVGLAKTRNGGAFSDDISTITNGFEGPLAVVDVASPSHREPDHYTKILIPVNGTDVSRRAAEIGLVLAGPSKARVTALYVTRAGEFGKAARTSAMRRSEQAVLKEIGALAERHGVRLQNATRVNLAPDEAILAEARRGYDLIVLGASRRPGDRLFFGNTAAAVLDRSAISHLFVAS